MAIGWAGLIFFLSSRPREKLPDLGFLNRVVSTTAHFVLFAILMWLLQHAMNPDGQPIRWWSFWVGLGLVAIYAFSDEYHQSFVPGREPDPLDWLTDMAGAAAAGLMARRAAISRHEEWQTTNDG